MGGRKSELAALHLFNQLLNPSINGSPRSTAATLMTNDDNTSPAHDDQPDAATIATTKQLAVTL